MLLQQISGIGRAFAPSSVDQMIRFLLCCGGRVWGCGAQIPPVQSISFRQTQRNAIMNQNPNKAVEFRNPSCCKEDAASMIRCSILQ